MSATDFRSDPSESPEGKGLARRAWETYVEALRPVSEGVVVPALRPAIERYSRYKVGDLIGFWTLWHLYGGFEGLEQNYGMHRSTIWRKVAKFRKILGAHPDEYRFEGISIDTASFWKAAAADAERRGRD
jgi:hypothetical protein